MKVSVSTYKKDKYYPRIVTATEKTNRITLYRLKEGVTHEDVNLDTQGWDKQHDADGVIVYTKAQEKDPAWNYFVRNYLPDNESHLIST